MCACDDSARCAEGELWPYGRDEAMWGHGRGRALVVLCVFKELLFRVMTLMLFNQLRYGENDEAVIRFAPGYAR